MHPFVLRLPDGVLARCRVRARTEHKPFADWLRDVLRWYLTTWLPAHRQAAASEALPDGAVLVTIAPNRRLGLAKRLLDPLGIRPGDRVVMRTVGRALIVTKPNAPSWPGRTQEVDGDP
jgi:plasmid stability protein